MPVCPITLLSQANGIYYYQGIDCSNPRHTTVITANRILAVGCDSNPDCQGMAGGTPVNPMMALFAVGTTGLVMTPTTETVDAAGPPDLIVSEEVLRKGIPTPLSAGDTLTIPNATIDPKYSGKKAYFVVKVDGRDRYVQVLRATWNPPSCLAFRSAKGKSTRHDSLPPLTLRIGQEAELPEGVVPRQMTLVGKPDGYVRVVHGGRTAARTPARSSRSVSPPERAGGRRYRPLRKRGSFAPRSGIRHPLFLPPCPGLRVCGLT
ncbi:MAG: hypothetical protein U0794_18145 [Isosphaeraceae bacterium]